MCEDNLRKFIRFRSNGVPMFNLPLIKQNNVFTRICNLFGFKEVLLCFIYGEQSRIYLVTVCSEARKQLYAASLST